MTLHPFNIDFGNGLSWRVELVSVQPMSVEFEMLQLERVQSLSFEDEMVILVRLQEVRSEVVMLSFWRVAALKVVRRKVRQGPVREVSEISISISGS